MDSFSLCMNSTVENGTSEPLILCLILFRIEYIVWTYFECENEYKNEKKVRLVMIFRVVLGFFKDVGRIFSTVNRCVSNRWMWDWEFRRVLGSCFGCTLRAEPIKQFRENYFCEQRRWKNNFCAKTTARMDSSCTQSDGNWIKLWLSQIKL